MLLVSNILYSTTAPSSGKNRKYSFVVCEKDDNMCDTLHKNSFETFWDLVYLHNFYTETIYSSEAVECDEN